MARFTSKEALLQEIDQERQKMEGLLATLNADQMTQPGACGEWSVKDIMCHLSEWEQMVLAWYRAGLRGEVPKTPADDLNWGQLPALNQRIYEMHRDRPLPKVQAWFAASHAEILATIRALPESELGERGLYLWMGKNALASYLTSCTSSHYRWARDLIRKWLKAQAKA